MAIETYGKYQLLKKLATGGMAQIYLARSVGPEGFEKLLVVKRILPHLAENDEFIKMFLDEARIAARLNHPNIVQIFDLGAQDDSFFIAMEYIHGEDVRRVWKHSESRGHEIPPPLVARVIIDACAGLDYAHKKIDANGKALGIVHRDISPQNILVTFEGGVKVVDFGIAKAADQATVTRSGVLKGKYSYMSPEQAAGQKIDARTDTFALGVVLYELLTGTRLFKRASDIQTLNAVSECVVAPASQVNSSVPKSLDSIVLKALSKHAKDRFQEAAHLQAALEDWVRQHKQPASSMHLATYMQELYADRLKREAEEGRVLVESVEGAKAPDDDLMKRSPSRPPSFHGVESESRERLPPPVPELGGEELKTRTGERTTKPGVDDGLRKETAELTGRNTDTSRTVPPTPTAPIVAFIGAAALLTGVVAFLLWPGRRGDADKPKTAPTAAAKPADAQKPEVAKVEAQPKPEAAANPPAPAPVAVAPPPPVLDAGAQLAEVKPSPSPEAPAAIQAQPSAPVAAAAPAEAKKPRKEGKRAEEGGRAYGTVRFVVKPWATVQCGQYKFGDTPFPDQQMLAGQYQCTFSNPDLGEKKTLSVVVQPNETVKVPVNLLRTE